MSAVRDVPGQSRRERKKQATRQALQDAALRLASEHGADRVTVEDICAEADVAPRTFFNHFTGKDEALVGDGPFTAGPEMWETFAAGGPTGELWKDLHAVLRNRAPDIADRRAEFLERRRLMEQYPGLLPRFLGQLNACERSLIAAIAARSDTDPDLDAYPQLVAGVAMTAMRVALRRWGLSSGTRRLEAYIDENFALIDRGL